jgi:hypothetical protein
MGLGTRGPGESLHAAKGGAVAGGVPHQPMPAASYGYPGDVPAATAKIPSSATSRLAVIRVLPV